MTICRYEFGDMKDGKVVSDDGRLKYSVVKKVIICQGYPCTRKDRDYDEWQARAYIDGEYYKTVHTGGSYDKEEDNEYKQEAIMGAEAGIANWNKMTDEQKEEAKADAIKWDEEN